MPSVDREPGRGSPDTKDRILAAAEALFMEQGYNYFDTSFVYHSGNSEAALGKLLVDRYPRDSFLISTKMPLKWMHKPEEKETAFLTQLERCHLEYFDFYLIHAIMRDTYELSKKWGTLEFLKPKRAEGRENRPNSKPVAMANPKTPERDSTTAMALVTGPTGHIFP